MMRSISVVLMSLGLVTGASADNFRHHHNGNVAVRADGLVVVNGIPYVPYAVPVGVPVANLSNHTYSLDATQYQAPKYDHSARNATPEDETKLLLRELIAEMRAMRTGGVVEPSAVPKAELPKGILLTDVMGTACMKCHTGTSPRGKVRFDLDTSADLKLKMLKRAQAGEMPPDKPLTGEQMGALIQQLTVTPAASAKVTTQGAPETPKAEPEAKVETQAEPPQPPVPPTANGGEYK